MFFPFFCNRFTLKILRANNFIGLSCSLVPWTHIHFSDELGDVDVFGDEKKKGGKSRRKKREKKKDRVEKEVERSLLEAAAEEPKKILLVSLFLFLILFLLLISCFGVDLVFHFVIHLFALIQKNEDSFTGQKKHE